jgi:3-phenylpropionate/trans-cinnamate dioxygenase ferredoxin reductase subunit
MFDRHVQLESVHNAIEQQRAAFASILHATRPRPQVPWFWSDQYDVKLQTAGLCQEHDQTILWGEPGRSCFAIYYLRNARLIAIDAVNAPAHMAFGKKRLLSADAFSAREISF